MMSKPEILRTFLSGRVLVVVDDITAQDVDAIVNAANSTLLGGGGVDLAIHRKGGPAILEACRELRRTRFPKGLPTGEAVITTGGQLRAKHVIHTVGPVKGMHGERDAEMLAACYRKSLALAAEYGLLSVAFPAISTGAFGYPREQAAGVSSEAIEAGLREETTVKEVRLVFFAAEDARVFLQHQRFGT
jgi:O-acetyl-ADP-ribose deacetylase